MLSVVIESHTGKYTAVENIVYLLEHLMGELIASDTGASR